LGRKKEGGLRGGGGQCEFYCKKRQGVHVMPEPNEREEGKEGRGGGGGGGGGERGRGGRHIMAEAVLLVRVHVQHLGENSELSD